MTWILSLWANPLARKFIIYGGAALAILLCLRWWGNAQWRKGETAGRIYEAKAIEKAKQSEWAAKDAAIAAAAKNIDSDKQSVKADQEALKRDRANLSRTLSDSLADIQKERMRQYANAAAVPDNRVWEDIRAISRELDAHP
jgi:hypothetical protein